MATVRLTAYDVVRRVLAVGAALCGVVLVVGGVTMFWGPLRQVLAAPVIMVLGVIAYVAGRTMWWLVDQDLRARS
jgi:cytochrome b subunit of formate dehydrogenase